MERHQRRFRSAVCPHHGARFHGLPARHGQDSPASLVSHVRQHCPRHEERRTVVQIQHLVEGGIVRIGHAFFASEATHRMYQDVDTSELGHEVPSPIGPQPDTMAP
jgi:hypothetical protein